MRSPQTDLSSPMETQTSVYRKSDALDALGEVSVRLILAPVSLAIVLALLDQVLLRPQVLRRAERTSMPSFAPPISSESPML